METKGLEWHPALTEEHLEPLKGYQVVILSVDFVCIMHAEALLISEPKIRFSVPIKVTHYPEYLEEREKVVYALPKSRTMPKMDETLRKIRQAGKTVEM